MHGTVRLSDFCAFSGDSLGNFQLKRRTGKVPFAVPEGAYQHHRYAAPDFLAQQLLDALRGHGLGVRPAAQAVLASRAAPEFLARLARGEDVADLVLVEAREWDDSGAVAQEVRRASCVRASDLAPLLSAEARPILSAVVVPILPAWRAAIDRADAVGLELLPGSVARKGGRDG